MSLKNKKSFSYNFRIRYSEVDAQKIVYNSHYLTFLDVSIFEFFDYTLSFSKLEESVLKNKYKLSPNKIINSTPGFNKEYFFHNV